MCSFGSSQKLSRENGADVSLLCLLLTSLSGLGVGGSFLEQQLYTHLLNLPYLLYTETVDGAWIDPNVHGRLGKPVTPSIKQSVVIKQHTAEDM